MKLIIAGGRDYRLTQEDIAKLDALLPRVTEVVSGHAAGADRDGEAWAWSKGLPVRVFKANWGEYGDAAGPIRNRTMAHYADAVALFPGGRGTEDMALQAERKGLEVFDYRRGGDP